MHYLIDEDLATDIARIGRRIGLDILSVHELGRRGWSDEEQLETAAREGRCVVTGNRGDFEDLTNQFFLTGRPHAGVLFVHRALRHADPAAVARALLAFERARGSFSMEYVCDFLQPARTE
jgi:predicted nuclease of predicted toxin-antitoxin system